MSKRIDKQYRRYSPLSHAVSSRRIQSELRMDAKFFTPRYHENEKRLRWLSTESGWEVKTLGSLMKKGPRRGAQPQYSRNGDLPVLKTVDIQNKWISWEETLQTSSFLVSSKQALVRKNELLITSTGEGSWGRAGLCDIELAAVDGHLTIVPLDTDQIDPFYVLAYFWTPFGRSLFEQRVRGCTGQTEIYPNDIAEVLLAINNGHAYNVILNQMKQSFKAWVKANECLEKIHNTFTDELGVIKDRPLRTYVFPKYLAQSEKRRIDPHYFNPFYSSISTRIIEKKNAQPLTKLADISHETISNTDILIPDPFQYIEIDGINTRFGTIQHTTRTNIHSAPSRAQKVVTGGAIILSMVRPYLNAITRCLKDHEGYICSTGFSVLLPKNGIDPDYLCAFLRSPWGLKQLEQKMSNANYPALTETWLDEVFVPGLFSPTEKEISETMKKMRYNLTESETLRKKAIKNVEKLIQGKPIKE